MKYQDSITKDHTKICTVQYTDNKGMQHCIRGSLRAFLEDMQKMSLYEIASIIKNAEITEG